MAATVDTKDFDKLAAEFRELRARLTEVRPLVANATVEAYRSGVKIKYILDALDVSIATVYNWINSAGAGVYDMTPKKLGRPRKVPERATVPEVVSQALDNLQFAWFEDRVRVDANGRRVLIDTERLQYDGDRELGQLLVSGTDINMIRKFNNFVNGA